MKDLGDRSSCPPMAEDSILDGLLEEQADWLQNQVSQSRPTVRLVRMEKKRSEDSSKPSREDHQRSSVSLFRCRRNNSDMQTGVNKTPDAQRELTQVNLQPSDDTLPVGKIVERMWPDATGTGSASDVSNYVDVPQRGFPVATRRVERTPKECDTDVGSLRLDAESIVGDDPTLRRVAAMSQEEREDAIRELESAFGHDLVNRLRDRAKRKLRMKRVFGCDAPRDPASTAAAVVSANGTLNGSDKRFVKIELPGAAESKACVVNMHEVNKLLWSSPAGELPSDRKPEKSESQTPLASLRFHLDGRPLRLCNRIRPGECHVPELFHHGEEPHLPGYTMHEIVDYWLPSVNSKQRLIALRTLRSIIMEGRRLVAGCPADDVGCSRHSYLWSPALKKKQHHGAAGFGSGLNSWERFVFETLEIHWKALLSSYSSSLAVRIAAVQLLGDLLLPDREEEGDALGMIGSVNLFDALQRPALRRAQLSSWPSAYRRIVMPESFETLCSACGDLDASFKLDESELRLSFWFTGRAAGSTDEPIVQGLSAFDPVVHLLLANPPTSEVADEESEAFSSNSRSSSPLGTLLAVVLAQHFGNPFAERAVIRVCTALAIHSEAAVSYAVLEHTTLMQELQRLILSLTAGTTEHEERCAQQPAADTNAEHELVRLKIALLFFVRVLSTCLADECYLHRVQSSFIDTMAAVVLIRQALMDENVYVPSGTDDSQSNTCQPNPDQEILRCEALATLATWERQGLWREDLDSYYATFSHWQQQLVTRLRSVTAQSGEVPHENSNSDNDCNSMLAEEYPRPEHTPLLDSNRPLSCGVLSFPSPSRHPCLPTEERIPNQVVVDPYAASLVCLTQYLWTALLTRPEDEPLVSLVLAFVARMVDVLELLTTSLCTVSVDSAEPETELLLRFFVELLNACTVLTSSLWSVWQRRQKAGTLSEMQLHEIHSLCETLKRFQPTLQKLRSSCHVYLWENVLQPGESQQVWAWDMTTVTEEAGLVGRYTQIPRYPTGTACILLAFRVVAACAELEATVNRVFRDTFSQVDSSSTENPPYFVLSGMMQAQLQATQEAVRTLVGTLTERHGCLASCQGHDGFCGAPDAVRSVPTVLVLYDCLQALDALVVHRAYIQQVDVGTVRLNAAEAAALLAAACTTGQLDEVLTLLSPVSSSTGEQRVPLRETGFSMFRDLCCGERFSVGLMKQRTMLLAANPFYAAFRLIAVVIGAHYKEGGGSCVAEADQCLTHLLFSSTRSPLFPLVLKHGLAASLVEQLGTAYATVRHRGAKKEPLSLEIALVEAWTSVEQSLHKEMATQDKGTALLTIRLEKVLSRVLSTFKQVPQLPSLCYKLLDTLSGPLAPSECQTLFFTDTTALQLLRRHCIRPNQ